MQEKTKKIRLCFFSPASHVYFTTGSNQIYGGAELQMYLLATRLSEISNFDTSFFIGGQAHAPMTFPGNIKLIKSFNLPQSENILSKLVKAIKYFFLLAKHRPDVIITTTANSIVGITAFYKQILKIKHIHRTASQIDVDLSWIKENGIAGKIYNYGLKNADKIIVQNKGQQRLLKANHSVASEVLKNAISLHNAKPVAKSGFLWVGRYNILKQPELFIDLAKSIPTAMFTMICPYNKEDYNNWKVLREKAVILSNIDFIEKVEYPKIQKYFNQAAVFVNTSSTEGFPNTFLQAAIAKTPVISLNVNPDGFLTEHNCGVFCSGNIDYLVKQCKFLINKKEKRETMADNIVRYFKDNHDINIVVKKLERIVSNLL